MRYLQGEEKKKSLEYILMASQIAKSSTCERDKCGSIIVKDNEIIGSGFNSPPQNKESQRRCLSLKNSYHKKVTDKTCCVHAEQRAIINALKSAPEKIFNSTLYFIRLNTDEEPSFAGKPYCTICSKMALDVGISEFVLLHENGICVYDTEEYNKISFEYRG